MFSWIQSRLRWLMSSNSPNHKPDGSTRCREQRPALSPPDFQVAEFQIGTYTDLSDSLVTTIDVTASPGWIGTEINAEKQKPLELTADEMAWHLRMCIEGNQLMDQGRFSEAAEAFSKAIDLRPEFPDALAKRSICYRESGDDAITVGEDSTAYQAFLRSRNDVYRFADLQGSLDWTQADMLFALEIRIAQTLSRTGRPSEVLDACAAACRLLQPVVESSPETEITSEERSFTRKRHRAEMRNLRDILLWLLKNEPDLPTLLAVCTGCLNVGRTCHTALKMFDLAEELFDRGIDILMRLSSGRTRCRGT